MNELINEKLHEREGKVRRKRSIHGSKLGKREISKQNPKFSTLSFTDTTSPVSRFEMWTTATQTIVIVNRPVGKDFPLPFKVRIILFGLNEHLRV